GSAPRCNPPDPDRRSPAPTDAGPAGRCPSRRRGPERAARAPPAASPPDPPGSFRHLGAEQEGAEGGGTTGQHLAADAAEALRLQRVAALVDGQNRPRPAGDLDAQRARAAAQIRHVESGEEPPQGTRPELEGLARLEQPLVERLPVFPAAEQLGQPRQVAVAV